MKTVENKTIRVTVSDELYSKYLKNNGSKTETLEQRARGEILSDAMRCIGNSHELIFMELEAQMGFDSRYDEIVDYLIAKYICEHHELESSEILMRYFEGHRMSERMRSIVIVAQVNALNALKNNREDVLNEFKIFAKHKFNIESNYRRRFSKINGMEIEILGKLPQQIGLCRTLNG